MITDEQVNKILVDLGAIVNGKYRYQILNNQVFKCIKMDIHRQLSLFASGNKVSIVELESLYNTILERISVNGRTLAKLDKVSVFSHVPGQFFAELSELRKRAIEKNPIHVINTDQLSNQMSKDDGILLWGAKTTSNVGHDPEPPADLMAVLKSREIADEVFKYHTVFPFFLEPKPGEVIPEPKLDMFKNEVKSGPVKANDRVSMSFKIPEDVGWYHRDTDPDADDKVSDFDTDMMKLFNLTDIGELSAKINEMVMKYPASAMASVLLEALALKNRLSGKLNNAIDKLVSATDELRKL